MEPAYKDAVQQLIAWWDRRKSALLAERISFEEAGRVFIRETGEASLSAQTSAELLARYNGSPSSNLFI